MHPPRRKPAQLHLFAHPDGCDPPATPAWQSLPCPTRQRATALLTQLLLDHLRRRNSPTTQDEERTDV